jgi:AAA family ATP:ADP antiporter
VLRKYGIDPSTKAEVARQIPAVLERMDTQLSVQALLAFLDTADIALRLEALRSLNTIQRDFPHRKIPGDEVVGHIIEEATIFKKTLGVLYIQLKNDEAEKEPEVHQAREALISLLERRLDGTLERIFRLLGLRYPAEDVIPVYEGLKNINPDVRMNSVEFLENMLEPGLKKTLVPIAETATLDTVSNEAIDTLKVRLPDEKTCFELLLEGRDPKLKLSVFQLISAIGKPEYLDMIRPYTTSAQPKVKEMALKILSEKGV